MRYLYALHDVDKSRGAIPIIQEDAEDWNAKGYGIFASVNSFNTSKRVESNLDKLLFWFIDMDDGSKSRQAQMILNFKLIPSLVIETKNGHHVYWKMNEQQNLGEYKTTLRKLIKHFKSDDNAKDGARILRAAGFYHLKNPLKPFLVKIIFQSDKNYSAKEINAALPEIENKTIVEKPIKYISSGGDIWAAASNIKAKSALSRLSNAEELNGDEISFSTSLSGKEAILINGKASSCWIDLDGKIGSISGGGPTIIQWIAWYGFSKADTAKIIEKYFPEIIPSLGFTLDFN